MSARAPQAGEAVVRVPRRWSETVDGIAWLPRLIDKARMAQAGSLGAYLFGHSPFDAAMLDRLGTTTDEFAAIVARTSNDAEVLAALRARGFDEARVRRWSARLPRTARFYAPLWDLDDGYAKPNVAGRVLLRAWRLVEAPVMALLRVIVRRP